MHQRTDTHITENKPASQKCNIKKERKPCCHQKCLLFIMVKHQADSNYNVSQRKADLRRFLN